MTDRLAEIAAAHADCSCATCLSGELSWLLAEVTRLRQLAGLLQGNFTEAVLAAVDCEKT